MKLRRFLTWTVIVVAALTVAVESSILLKDSLLRPRRPDPCFSCRPEDRPFAYSLITYMSKLKDMFVRGLNAIVENAKKNELK